MAEELPDGTRQGYFTSCDKCRKTIETNIQGNSMNDHECIKIVKLSNGGGSIAIIDFLNEDISFTDYNIKSRIDNLSFNDIKTLFLNI